MDKSYNPKQLEKEWYQKWEDKGYFSPDITVSQDNPFCIMIPPPNVTGVLHMGHAFQDSIMDVLTRYHRMCGQKTLWQPGTDHAGIATQMVVERMIGEQNETRHDYGRERFIEKVWQWKEQSGNKITQQLRRMGASADWQNERFTMDDGLSKAVNKVFIDLYEQGLIYRGKRLVNWDPILHTALSDLEVLSEEEGGKIYHLKYPLSNGEGNMIVATTRPETMLGDSAVAVNPADERYQHLIGQTVDLPLTNRQIPIIADDHANPEFGSGCVKITPAHDFNDYQVWLRHRDDPMIKNQIHGGLINILTQDAAIRQNNSIDGVDEKTLIPEQYIGLDRFDAREKIISDLQQQQLVVEVRDHKLMMPRGDRTGAIIEPYLTDQWYVDLTREVLDDGRPGGKAQITQPAIEAVSSGAIEFVPKNWEKTYYQWLENIEDWCISRQIWWGHRIPAWYDEQGNIYVGESEAAIRQKHQLADDHVLSQDEDVLDTWFSSALWPFSTLGWPDETERLKTFYPTSVLVTGFDIIFFWVARMIMFGCKFLDNVPFHQVYIHGLIRDSHGQKMSKSKGNVLDPIDLIDGIDLEALVEKRTQGMMQPHLKQKISQQTRRDFPNGIPSFGTDALRFTFIALASNGRDINFDLDRTEGYRNFCNKIWNAARFVLMHCENQDCGQERKKGTLSHADKWMISQLQKSELAIASAIEKYRFDMVAQEIYELVWNKYCDWYLELCKPILNNDNADDSSKIGTRQTLVRVLETLMRLAHPIMPYITEEIWQKIAPLAGKSGETIMLQPYPKAEMGKVYPSSEERINWVMQCIYGLRKIRGEMNISPAKPLSVILSDATQQDLQQLADTRIYLDELGKVDSVDTSEQENAPSSTMFMVGNMKVLVPLAGLIDKDQELARLDKLLQQTKAELARINNKLSNQGFVEKAPAAVIDKEKQALKKLTHQQQSVLEQIEEIAKL